jgi:hypothetical protein
MTRIILNVDDGHQPGHADDRCLRHSWDFQVLDMLASDRQVAVEVQISIAMPGGDSITDEEVHLYSLNDEGRINRMRHYVDTAKQIRAYGLE